MHFLNLGFAQAVEYHQLLNALFLNDIVSFAQGHRLTGLKAASGHFSHGYTSYVWAVFQRRNEHLWGAFFHFRSRDYLKYGVEKGRDVICRLLPVIAHPPLLGTTIYSLEIQLVFRSAEVEHQVEYFFLNCLGTAIQLVHLVDYDYRFLAQVYGLLKHETGLWHATFKGIHEKDYAVAHIEHSLHLSSEVAVARGVDYIDFDALIRHGHILGKYCYASFTLKVVVVQDQLAQLFLVAHQGGLVNHFIHKCGLTMVDMGYNSYISDVLHIFAEVSRMRNDY